MKVWVLHIPRGVLDPVRGGVDASSRDDAREVRKGGAPEEEANVDIELLGTREALIEPADLIQHTPAVEGRFGIEIVLDQWASGSAPGQPRCEVTRAVREELFSKNSRSPNTASVPSLKLPSLFAHSIRKKNIVSIEELDELSGGHFQAAISCCRRSPVVEKSD